jgi:hypothetical protein
VDRAAEGTFGEFNYSEFFLFFLLHRALILVLWLGLYPSRENSATYRHRTIGKIRAISKGSSPASPGLGPFSFWHSPGRQLTVGLLFPRLGFYTFTASGAVEMAGIAIRLRNIVAARPKPKLLPHLNEACTAILTVQKIENGGQDRALRP